MAGRGGTRVGAGRPAKHSSAAEKNRVYLANKKAEEARIKAIADLAFNIAHQISVAATLGNLEAKAVCKLTYLETLQEMHRQWLDVVQAERNRLMVERRETELALNARSGTQERKRRVPKS